MERKTKEQLIIDQINLESLQRGEDPVTELTLREDGDYDVLIPPITLAMQAYADQEMALFAEWLAEAGYKYHSTNTWLEPNGLMMFPNQPLTTQQLIDKYKNNL